jgi:phosphotriesterase-related protein
VDLVKAAADAAAFPVVVATGIYRQPWVPDWALEASQDFLYDWMRKELEVGIDQTGVLAGFVKLSAGDDGLTPVEEKILRAAVCAARKSNALIASHSIHGKVVEQQIAVMEEEGFDLGRFVWVHAQVDPLEYNLKLAKLGLWIEYDGINGTEDGDAEYLRRIEAMVAAGHEDQILLSMDRGWYSPAEPGGGTPQPFTLLAEVFLPKLRAAGFSEAMIEKFTVTNPFNAFAR